MKRIAVIAGIVGFAARRARRRVGILRVADAGPWQGGARHPAIRNFPKCNGRHPTDEWGRGKAFRCEAADCGAEVNLYIRAKIGFCNCQTGVSDDAELERLGDFG